MSDDYEPRDSPIPAPLVITSDGARVIRFAPIGCTVTNAGKHELTLAPSGYEPLVLKPGESATWPWLERVQGE